MAADTPAEGSAAEKSGEPPHKRTVTVAWAPPGTDFNDVLKDGFRLQVADGRVTGYVCADGSARQFWDPIPLDHLKAKAAKGAISVEKQAVCEFIAQIFDHRGPIVLPEIPAQPAADRRPTRPRRRPTAAAGADSPAGAEPPDNGLDKPDAAAPAIAGGGNGVAPPTERAPGGDRGDDGQLDLRLAFYPHTDLGNAERFRERYRDKLLWAPEIGPFWWDGARYNREGADEQVRIAAHQTARAIQREAEVLSNSDRDVQVGTKYRGKPDEEAIMMSDALVGWGRMSEQSNHLSAIAKESPPYLTIDREQLDADPLKFNVANGTLSFDKKFDGYVDFKPHDPADLMTKISPTLYDPAATCPLFDQFLAQVQPNEAVRRFILQWLGLSLTGDTREQKICIFWGEGNNGKSTLVEICAHIAGDYSQSIPVETFVDSGRARSPGQASPDLARLPRVRFLRTSEPPRGAKLAEAQIKLATGGEPITARHLNKEFFDFRPEFKLTICGNYRLRILGGDLGIWRRVVFVPWPVQILKEQLDDELKQKLLAEAPGILNRLLDGMRDWLDNGLVLPPGVVEATADYRADSDPAGEFLKECVAEAPEARVRANRMHAVFKAWAKANAFDEWSEKGLSSALKNKRLSSMRSNGMWWKNVKLIKDEHDFVDADGQPHAADGAAKGANDDDVTF